MEYNNNKTFVEVFRTENVAIADLVKEVLEDNEIICYLQDYSLARIYPTLAAPQIKVMVYREDIEEAEEIIRLFFREEGQ